MLCVSQIPDPLLATSLIAGCLLVHQLSVLPTLQVQELVFLRSFFALLHPTAEVLGSLVSGCCCWNQEDVVVVARLEDRCSVFFKVCVISTQLSCFYGDALKVQHLRI